MSWFSSFSNPKKKEVIRRRWKTKSRREIPKSEVENKFSDCFDGVAEVTVGKGSGAIFFSNKFELVDTTKVSQYHIHGFTAKRWSTSMSDLHLDAVVRHRHRTNLGWWTGGGSWMEVKPVLCTTSARPWCINNDISLSIVYLTPSPQLINPLAISQIVNRHSMVRPSENRPRLTTCVI